MRSAPSILVALLLSAPLATRAAEQMTCIEQEVVREQVEGRSSLRGEQRICFDDQHIRNEISWGQERTVALFDLSAERVALIPTSDPQYVEVSLSDYLELVAMRLHGSGLNDATAQPELTVGDETRRIGDWTCRKVVFRQGGRLPVRAVMWVSTETALDFAAWLGVIQRLGLLKPLGRLGSFVGRIPGVPIEMRIVQTVSDQELTTRIRVQAIRRQPRDAALFRIPEGYQRLEAGSLPNGADPAGPSDPQGG